MDIVGSIVTFAVGAVAATFVRWAIEHRYRERRLGYRVASNHWRTTGSDERAD